MFSWHDAQGIENELDHFALCWKANRVHGDTEALMQKIGIQPTGVGCIEAKTYSFFGWLGFNCLPLLPWTFAFIELVPVVPIFLLRASARLLSCCCVSLGVGFAMMLSEQS